MNKAWLLLALALVAGCATGPRPVGEEIAGSPSVTEAVADPKAAMGARVRWGGIVARVENRADVSLVEVIGKTLEESGRPEEGAPSRGRFLARIKGFADPADFERGKEISVLGVVAGTETRAIGDFEYRYPVVDVERVHVWAPRPMRREPAYPYYYDPWGPFHPWPYYRPYGPWWPYYW
ncbi:MAG: Slp family lipoprotein [Thiohalomonadaceae bacterium]